MFAAALFAVTSAVSLDYCADQYLLALAAREQIGAVSRGADDDYSHMRNAAAGLRKIRPTLEEVLPLAPDIILRQWGGGAAAPFSRGGATVVTLGFPEDFEGVEDNLRLAAAALHQEPQGEAHIRAMRAELEALSADKNTSVRALYVTPGGVTAGAHTMIDAIMRAAGVINIAAENGLSYWPALPAEALIAEPPDLIVAGFFDSGAEAINYWSAARHPAIRRQLRQTPTVYLPPDLISCAGWFAVDAAKAVAEAAKAIGQ